MFRKTQTILHNHKTNLAQNLSDQRTGISQQTGKFSQLNSVERRRISAFNIEYIFEKIKQFSTTTNLNSLKIYQIKEQAFPYKLKKSHAKCCSN